MPDQDHYLFPTDEMLEEYSDHYFREWNPFCEKTFMHLKNELDTGRGQAMTRGEWKRYFQSSNRGSHKPRLVCSQAFVEEGLSCIKGAVMYQPWNKRRIGHCEGPTTPVSAGFLKSNKDIKFGGLCDEYCHKRTTREHRCSTGGAGTIHVFSSHILFLNLSVLFVDARLRVYYYVISCSI